MDRALVRLFASFFNWSLNPYFLCRVHFIPLSSTYKEIYNIHAYFSGPTPSVLEAANSTLSAQLAEKQDQDYSPDQGIAAAGVGEGDRRLQRIARAGKKWKKTMGRKIDMEGGFPIFRFILF